MTSPLTPTGSPATFPGFGKLEFAPTNGPDDLFPTWVDITPYVETQSPGSPVDITRGRQSELSTVESSQLTCVLKNADGRFTFGNTGGAYGANWAPAKQIRYTETIGSRTFVLFQGWIEYPDIPAWKPIGQQYVQLTALDRLTRLGRDTPFVSTLTEWIRFNGPSAGLVYEFPLADAATGNVVDLNNALTLTRSVGLVWNAGVVPNTGLVLSAAAPDTIPADDLTGVVFTQQLGPTGALAVWQQYDQSALFPTLTVAAGQSIAVAVWVNFTASLPTAFNGALVNLFGPAGSFMQLNTRGSDSTWFPSVEDMGGGGSVGTGGSGATNIGVWQLVALRLTESSGLVEFWVHGARPVTFTIPSASQAQFWGLRLAGQAPVEMAHLQVYYGPSATAYTRAYHLSQAQQGYQGFEQQTTGQRINTILDYAGVPSAKRQVDPGQSYMQVAPLAGQTPLALMQNASSTERGRLFISGDDRVVFHDRVRTYNV